MLHHVMVMPLVMLMSIMSMMRMMTDVRAPLHDDGRDGRDGQNDDWREPPLHEDAPADENDGWSDQLPQNASYVGVPAYFLLNGS